MRNSHKFIFIIGLDEVKVYWFVENPFSMVASLFKSTRDDDIYYYPIASHPLEKRVTVRNFGLQNRLLFSTLQVEDLRTSDDNMTIGCETFDFMGEVVDAAKTSIRVHRKFNFSS